MAQATPGISTGALRRSIVRRLRRATDIELREELAAKGYVYLPTFSAQLDARSYVTLARGLGPLYVPPDLDPDLPVITTRPAVDATRPAPFDRAEGISWHNDFSTHPRRPAVSLAWLERADPRGPKYGAWRVASCDRVLEHLFATAAGEDVVGFLRDTEVPYSYEPDGIPMFFRALEPRGRGRLGMRFYGRAMRDGARLAYGVVPDRIGHAIAAVEAAADAVGEVLEAPTGALLIADNWHALHDRLPQTVEPGLPLRRAWLCFVERMNDP